MSEHTAEKDAPTYGPCNAECNGCPECDPGLRTDAEKDAGDYTACGHRLIAPMVGQPGTARVAVYCDLPVDHDGHHHAAVEWDEFGHAAQGGDAWRYLSPRVTSPAEKDPATLTDKEIELREWLRAQPGGGERWMVIKAGFRRSYDMGVNHGWGLGAKHMRAVLTRVLPPGGGRA